MVLGWDIGGVHTKVAMVVSGRITCVREEPFEIQRQPEALASLLRRLAGEAGASGETRHAVTMTAELSQMFRGKREGVAFVLDAVEQAFPAAAVHVFTVTGAFVSPAEARRAPMAVAAANWMATARIVAQQHRDALLVDVGSTTTDVIPIAGGEVVASGRTDLERLGSGELVYTGAVRTPVEAVVREVTVDGRRVGVSAEGFALMGDVHVWRRDLSEEDYSAPTPDGRAHSRDACGDRLLRVVCADREMLDDADISLMAGEIAAAQVRQIATAIRRVAAARPRVSHAVVTGRGAFLGAAAGREAGLDVCALEETLGADAARSAPAAAVALLYEQSVHPSRPASGFVGAVHAVRASGSRSPAIDVVVKVGGSALLEPDALDRVLAGLDAASGAVVIVPGGGAFADTVRDVDRRLRLSDTAAHWMAVSAMDQYAELLASRLRRGVVVRDLNDIRAALAGGLLPVLAPSGWLRREDPLPHSWDVTSDSIAAWVARVTAAGELVLIKPGSGREPTTVALTDLTALTDPYFAEARPAGLKTTVVFLDDLNGLGAALEGVRSR